MRIQCFMERKPAEIGGLVNGIGLTDRIEDDSALFRNVIDGQLHGRGKTADDKIHLFLFHQFQRARRRFPWIEFVVVYDQLRLSAVESAGVVELGNCELRGTNLILRFRHISPSQRNRKTDLDVSFLRLQQIDSKWRNCKRRAGADRCQETAAGHRPGSGLFQVFLSQFFSWTCIAVLYSGFAARFFQIRLSAVKITSGVSGISVIIAAKGFRASFTALATAAAAPAVPASPAPFAPSSVSAVGDTT